MYSIATYTGNGSATQFTIPCPYLAQAHLVVSVAGVVKTLGTDYTINTGTNKVVFGSAPANAAAVKIQRVTPRDGSLVNFTAGAGLPEGDLDTAALVSLYIDQEILDDAEILEGRTTAVEDHVDSLIAEVTAIKDEAEAARDAAAASAVQAGLHEDDALAAASAAELSALSAESEADDAAASAATATTQAGIATTQAGIATAAAATAAADAVAATIDAAIAAVQDELNDEVTAAETARDEAETARDVAIANSQLYISQIEREGFRNGVGSSDYGTFAGPTLSTTDFTFLTYANVDSLTSPRGFVGGDTNAFGFYTKVTTGFLIVSKVNTADVSAESTVAVTPGTGQVLAYVRSGTTGSYYVNGVLAGTCTDTNNYTVATNFLGALTGGVPLNGKQARSLLFNRALTQAEIQALIGRGLVPLPEQRGGSMTNLYSGQNADFTGGIGSWTTYGASTPTAVGNKLRVEIASGISGAAIYANPEKYALGRKYFARFTVSNFALTTGNCGFSLEGNPTTVPSITANGTYSGVITITQLTSGGIPVFIGAGGGSGQTLDIDDFYMVPLGTLFELDSGQRNAGYQIKDTSGNGRHVELPVSGVEIIDPASEGFISYTRTSDGYVIGDRVVIPTGYVIEELWGVGNGTATVGESTGTPANVVASLTLTSTPQRLTLLVAVTSNGKLYIDLGTATTATIYGRIKKL